MKKLLCAAMFCIAVSVMHAQTIQVEGATTQVEKSLFDTIASLPEVKERAAYVEKETKGARHIQLLLYMEPQSDFPYYWIKAGEDNGEHFVTHFSFLVSQQPVKIYYYNTLEDEMIELEKWREQRKKK